MNNKIKRIKKKMLLSGYRGEILENFGFFFKNFEKNEKKQSGTLSKTKKIYKNVIQLK